MSSGSEGEVWGVFKDSVMKREGVSKDNPEGTGWVPVDGKITQLDVCKGEVWGITSNNDVKLRSKAWSFKVRINQFANF